MTKQTYADTNTDYLPNERQPTDAELSNVLAAVRCAEEHVATLTEREHTMEQMQNAQSSVREAKRQFSNLAWLRRLKGETVAECEARLTALVESA